MKKKHTIISQIHTRVHIYNIEFIMKIYRVKGKCYYSKHYHWYSANLLFIAPQPPILAMVLFYLPGFCSYYRLFGARSLH